VIAVASEQAFEFHHVPVMLQPVIDWFGTVPAGWIVDTTLGGAGHSAALLAAYPHLNILGIDQDPLAINTATERLRAHHDRVRIVQARFDSMADAVATTQSAPIVGVLMDLGVSSAQFDLPQRGFSYRHDAPLDMRMDTTQEFTAASLLATWSLDQIADALRMYGDERFAGRIARAVIAARTAGNPITTTFQLVELVTKAIPAATRRTGGHPAKRSFQALRIAVNSELDVLGPAVETAIELLAPQGRLVVLSYHSGEDRIVKERLRLAETGGCTCPAGLPCNCGALPRGRSLKRGVIRPDETEVSLNPRAKSALARVFEKSTASTMPYSVSSSAVPCIDPSEGQP
jgi:16S rRNA (cytosine1402-N4)-methyltransferase